MSNIREKKVYIKGKDISKMEIIPRQQEEDSKYYKSILFMLFVFKNNLIRKIVDTQYPSVLSKDLEYIKGIEQTFKEEDDLFISFKKELFQNVFTKQSVSETIFLNWSYLLELTPENARQVLKEFFAKNELSFDVVIDFWEQMTDELFQHLGFKGFSGKQQKELENYEKVIYSDTLLLFVPWTIVHNHPEIYWDILILIRREDFDASSINSLSEDPINTLIPSYFLKKYPTQINKLLRMPRRELYLTEEDITDVSVSKEPPFFFGSYNNTNSLIPFFKNKTMNKQLIRTIYLDIIETYLEDRNSKLLLNALFSNPSFDFSLIMESPFHILKIIDWTIICAQPYFNCGILLQKYSDSFPEDTLFNLMLHTYMDIYSGNPNIDWSFVLQYPEYFSIYHLCSNPSFVWKLLYDPQIIERIDPAALSKNSNLNWNIVDEITKKYPDKEVFNKYWLSRNVTIPDWFINKYPQYINLSLLERIPWNVIRKQIARKDIETLKKYNWKNILKSPDIDLTLIFANYDLLRPIIDNEEYKTILLNNNYLDLDLFFSVEFPINISQMIRNKTKEKKKEIIQDLFDKPGKYIFIRPLLESLDLFEYLQYDNEYQEIHRFIRLVKPLGRNTFQKLFPSLYMQQLNLNALKIRINSVNKYDLKRNKTIPH